MATSDEVLRRIRNRIIEHLELASSKEAQLNYQQVCPVNVANEVFNQWGDWVAPGWRDDFTPGAIFTSAEVDAIREFDALLDQLVPWLPESSLQSLIDTPQWAELVNCAARTLGVFRRRGMLPED
jgi:hypothetical protein